MVASAMELDLYIGPFEPPLEQLPSVRPGVSKT
jgi:hypothetical protein